jgi:aminoglycoside phosphotransferase (APT) family kinase protein
MHGDYHFANLLVDWQRPGRVTAIIDWELATIGDPLLDLAWVMMAWPADDDLDAGRPDVVFGVDYSTMPKRSVLLSRYAKLTGRDVDSFDYYLVLARFKMAILLEAGYARFVAGRSWSEEHRKFGDIVLDLVDRAYAVVARAGSGEEH